MITTSLLPNGIRVVLEEIPTAYSVSVGVTVDTGSMYDPLPLRGISHMLEHMLFKGTTTRNAQQIAHQVERCGGYLNAETDRDHISFYARVTQDEIGTAVDVLADMLTHPLMDEQELQREKQVVLEEYYQVHDDPEDTVHDHLPASLWGRHPLAMTVLGTPSTIESISTDNLRQMMLERCSGCHLIISISGRFSRSQVIKLLTKAFCKIPAGKPVKPVREVKAAPKSKQISSRVKQCHYCTAYPAFTQSDDRRFELVVFDVLMGANMSSRLFQEIREKRGLVYHVQSFTNCYPQAGYFGTYACCSPNNVAEVKDLISSELAKPFVHGYHQGELETAKKQILGSMLISTESTESRMFHNMRSLLYLNRVVSIDEIQTKVSAVTAESMYEHLAPVFEAKPAEVILGPKSSIINTNLET